MRIKRDIKMTIAETNKVKYLLDIAFKDFIAGKFEFKTKIGPDGLMDVKEKEEEKDNIRVTVRLDSRKIAIKFTISNKTKNSYYGNYTYNLKNKTFYPTDDRTIDDGFLKSYLENLIMLHEMGVI